MINIPNVLTIAGSDSSGGAGIQADIKTLTALNVYGASVITNITAQNSHGVSAVHTLPIKVVEQQLDAVLGDIQFQAIKIGMLYNAEIIELVCDRLSQYQCKHLVVDPLLISTSGHSLLNKDAIELLSSQLLPLASLITPNLPEAARLLSLTNQPSTTDPENNTRSLAKAYQCSVLLKGGHSQDRYLTDYLCKYTAYEKEEIFKYSHRRLRTNNTHGTGCTLSSAVAAYLAKGYTLDKAVEDAISYLYHTIQHADQLNVGDGYGPVNHLGFSL